MPPVNFPPGTAPSPRTRDSGRSDDADRERRGIKRARDREAGGNGGKISGDGNGEAKAFLAKLTNAAPETSTSASATVATPSPTPTPTPGIVAAPSPESSSTPAEPAVVDATSEAGAPVGGLTRSAIAVMRARIQATKPAPSPIKNFF